MSELAYALYTHRPTEEHYYLRAVVFDPDHGRKLVTQFWPLHDYRLLRFVFDYTMTRLPNGIEVDAIDNRDVVR